MEIWAFYSAVSGQELGRYHAGTKQTSYEVAKKYANEIGGAVVRMWSSSSDLVWPDLELDSLELDWDSVQS